MLNNKKIKYTIDNKNLMSSLAAVNPQIKQL